MRNLVFLCLRLSGIPLLLRRLSQKTGVTILCYHDPAPEILTRHLTVLAKFYNLIPLRKYIEWRNGKTREPLPPYAMVVTLDDGHRGNAALAPVFKRHAVEPTIFLCSAIVGTKRTYWWKVVPNQDECERLKRVPDHERVRRLKEMGFVETRDFTERQALSDEEIVLLKDIVDFQCHTRLHPILPRCSAERAREEIEMAKAELELRLGRSVYALAYPNGDYSDRDIAFAREAGYDCALTTDAGFNTAETDLFRLKRIPMFDNADINELIVKTSGLWEFIKRPLYASTKCYPTTALPERS
jgi:peptidoglycan/xylan/chitin deacetylase (PgdA/CDA1 family)